MTPRLLPEDGAIFIATLQEVDNGQFQATCHAELDRLSNVLSESPEYHITDSRELARAWAHRQAAARGFPGLHWERTA